jgi:putative Mg2+ transporter-C (MgtC) family protein
MMTVTHTEMVLRMVTAMMLGAAIGFEREAKDHPAGLRTHILVALASATFMLVSTQFVYFQHYTKEELIQVDPSRIASGVVMGIGFLGAGSILRTGLHVHGLTTAASLWMVTAVGLAAGCGMFPEAVAATCAALFVLIGLSFIEGKLKREVKRKVEMEFDESHPGEAEVLAILRGEGVSASGLAYDRDLLNHSSSLCFEVKMPSDASVETILGPLEGMAGVRRVRVREAKNSRGE